MVKKLIHPLILVFLLVSVAAYPQARLLAKAGFLDLDRIVYEYTARYLDGEISRREKSLALLRASLQSKRVFDQIEEHESIEEKIREHREALASLRRDKDYFARTGELRSDRLAEIVEKDIFIAVRKTAEIEGYSIVLDKSGNFVYGSREVDLTDRVLQRLLRELSGPAGEE